MKDGVTLIADAIRKEQEELLKSQTTVGNNVIDVTAQFKKANKPTEDKNVDVSNKTDTSKIVTDNPDAPDGTYPDGAPETNE